jgi:hypothetical protein
MFFRLTFGMRMEFEELDGRPCDLGVMIRRPLECQSRFKWQMQVLIPTVPRKP